MFSPSLYPKRALCYEYRSSGNIIATPLVVGGQHPCVRVPIGNWTYPSESASGTYPSESASGQVLHQLFPVGHRSGPALLGSSPNETCPSATSRAQQKNLQYSSALASPSPDTGIPTAFEFSELCWATMLSDRRIAQNRFSRYLQHNTLRSIQPMKLCLSLLLEIIQSLLLHKTQLLTTSLKMLLELSIDRSFFDLRDQDTINMAFMKHLVHSGNEQENYLLHIFHIPHLLKNTSLFIWHWSSK